MGHGTLGWFELEDRDTRRSISHAVVARDAALALKEPWLTSDALVLAAAIAFAQQDLRQAGRLLGAANAGRARRRWR